MHSSIDGHLGFFLAITSYAAVNIEEHISF